jgi:hypothetical protein
MIVISFPVEIFPDLCAQELCRTIYVYTHIYLDIPEDNQIELVQTLLEYIFKLKIISIVANKTIFLLIFFFNLYTVIRFLLNYF